MGALNYFMDTFYLNKPIELIKQTANEWIEDKCPALGAALGFYTTFSLAPLILLLLSVFTLFMHGNATAQDRIKDQVGQFAGSSGAEVVGNIIATAASKPKAGIIGTVIGVVVALFGASCVFGQLQDSLNTIWGVKAKPGQGIMGYVKARFISFGMVGGVCFLLLVSVTVTTLIEGFSDTINRSLPGGTVLTFCITLALNFIVITALFAMIFKFLPDAKIAWSDVWIGAALTTVLFLIGKQALAIYLGSGSAGSAYGAASALITTLVWVYYSSQILLFGAEFTQVYANRYGSQIQPVEHAVRVQKKEVEIPG